MTSWHQPCITGDLDALKCLSDEDLFVRDYRLISETTALHAAVWSEQYHLLDYLVHERQFDINIRGIVNHTPLHFLCAIAQPGQIKILKWFIDNGADTNAVSCVGRTALHYCAAMNNIPFARYLLSRCDSLNVKDVDGWVPLYFAKLHQHHEMISLLTKYALLLMMLGYGLPNDFVKHIYYTYL